MSCQAGYCIDDGATTGTSGSDTTATTEAVDDTTSTSDPTDPSASTTDSTTSTTGGTTDDDTTGGDPLCGNGLIDDGEECDDGDNTDGNGCNNDCKPSGELQWVQTYNNPENLDDEAYGVAVDSDDNIIVIGYHEVSGAGLDILIRKYDSEGTLVWQRTYNGPLSQNDVGLGVSVDGNDNVVVTGWTTEAVGEHNVWLRKYNANGQVQWTETWNLGSDYGVGVATDSQANIVVIGSASVPNEGNNIVLLKYDGGGNLVWPLVSDGGAGLNDWGRGVAIDSSDNIVTLSDVNLVNDGINLTAKYSPNAVLLWNDSAYDLGWPGDTCVGPGDHSYSVGRNGSNGAWIRKYDADGNDLWDQNFAPQNGYADAADCGVDPAGAVTIGGSQGSQGQMSDILVQKYGSNGQIFWTRTQNGSANGSDRAEGVAIDSKKNIIVVGVVATAGEGDNWWIGKYSP